MNETTCTTKREEPAAVLFDLDGTLADPREGFVASIRHALEGEETASLSDAEIASRIGPPLRETLATLIGTDEGNRIDAAVARYREYYADTGIYQNTMYAGVPVALETIHGKGARIFLATSKPGVFAGIILELFDLRRWFDGVYGSELDGSLSNKGQLIARVLREESMDARDAIMVGDRAQDVVGALYNGIRPVGALWGYGSRAELEKAGAKDMAERPADLPGLLFPSG
jgi:phosphoglycolate phosphatase